MLHAKNLGLAAGILWSISMVICTMLAMYTGYSAAFLHLMESIYPGYTISCTGVFLGAVYGFIDGYIGFFLLAWLYNKISK